jgi:hypothetical protein
MVRFSDMLGGSGEPDDAHATKSVYAALSDDRAADDEPEGDEPDDDESEDDEPDEATGVAGADEPASAAERAPAPTFESPEDVLDRLTQYASSARAAEPVMPPDEPTLDERTLDEDAPDDDPLPPVGDDFLPRAKEIERKPGRSRKRRP